MHSADVPYSDLLPSMFTMDAGSFLLQLASEPDKDSVDRLIGWYSRDDAWAIAPRGFAARPGAASPKGTGRRLSGPSLLAIAGGSPRS